MAVKISSDGRWKFAAGFMPGIAMTAFGAGSFRETLPVVAALYGGMFVLTCGRPTRIMPSDMLEGFPDEAAKERHDRRAKRLGVAFGVIALPAIVVWAWRTTPI